MIVVMRRDPHHPTSVTIKTVTFNWVRGDAEIAAHSGHSAPRDWIWPHPATIEHVARLELLV